MPPKKGLKRKRLAKATTVEEPGSTEEPSPTVEPSTTTTVEPGSTEEPSPTAIEGEQQVLETLSPVLEESDKNEEENSKKNEEEESGEEEDDKEEEKEEGNEEENEEGEESSSDDGSRSLDRESSSDESKEDEIAPENATENAMEIDEETEAIPPLSMYFPPSEYVKKIKLSTRCYIHEVLTTFDELKPPMSKSERAFFEDHPSFQHVFHMPRDPNHRLMGMWMLLLRTARIDRKKEVWFIVNGVPIRYGISEHALISGFNCKNYALDYKNVGSMEFKTKHFKKVPVVKREDVRKKLIEMVPKGDRSKDRLRMMVLYFLTSIIVAPIKTGEKAPQVDQFCLKAVNDLPFCRNFQWGRYSFDYMLDTISHTMNHFNGFVTENEKYIWPVPGFCLPIELLAFEAIPLLREKFIEDITGADEGCPRMCKVKFKKNHLKGIPLDTINHELGTTQVIDCIVSPRIEEHALMRAITEEEHDVDMADPVVESWLKRHKEGRLIRFEELYQHDLHARGIIAGPEIAGGEDIPAVDGQELPSLAAVVEMIQDMKVEMTDQLNEILVVISGLDDTVNSLDERVKSLEAFREAQKVDKRKDQEEKNQENDGDPKETTQEKDGDPKDTTQEKDGDPQVTKMTTRSKRQLG
ncbi:hypothetical protein ISN45_Aa03g015760 [Arabidopsis thaliana x Arabidopsis arenosa]|uniref:DUF1985 domain-containing protein n=1 Tax=Arabidopsis thaliana x Arabidopsis arenosa TaxID=1240361 RepID=A0A8T2AVN1_9BRAS|nr:hypothetical protein ISN45_Aa03g015760 [Arabidopsis thaliana x Arabidopsis arenosa]